MRRHALLPPIAETCAALAILALAAGGCPSGTSADLGGGGDGGAPAGPETDPAAGPATDPAAGPETDPAAGAANGPSSGASSGGGAEVQTGILVVTPLNSAVNIDIHLASSDERVKTAQSANEIIELAPGTYRLREYFHDDFVFADSVTVVAGEVTQVTLGAILVTTAPGSEAAIYDIYNATGDLLLDQVNDTGVVRPAPAGSYLLKEYFHENFVYAANVVVSPGGVTTIALGAINLRSVPGGDAVYDIFAADGQTPLDQVSDTNKVRPVPAGTYVLKEYFHDNMIFADGVTVSAGAVTERSLGAIRYNGPQSIYDIYDASGEKLLDQVNDRGVIRSLAPGAYVLKPYFEKTILAQGVVVAAGAITEVP